MRPDAVAGLDARYRAVTPRSCEVYERARKVLPGGHTREVAHYRPYPAVISHGSGARLCDVDGNEYIDLVNNYTALVHGNAYAPVAEAVSPVLERGATFASIHVRQLELAELLVGRIPSAQQIRFTNSGTEASVLAARLARAATGRRTIVLFDGGYHGSAPPFSEGSDHVQRIPYNGTRELRAAVGSDVAAVFAEPFLGAGGVVPAQPGFLRAVQAACADSGALFILDEVQSLRNSPGGEQERQGLSPDLTVLGKVIGGGFPIGAVAGRADVLAHTTDAVPAPIPHSGTFNGHLAAMVAGAVTVRDLNEAKIADLDRKAGILADSIADGAASCAVPLVVSRAGSILNVHFTSDYPTTVVRPSSEASEQLRFLHLDLLLRGIYTTPRGMINVSTVITDEELSTAAIAYRDSLAELAESRVSQ